MTKEEGLKIGDVVQIDPNVKDSFFAGCFMLVTEVKKWGAQGFISIPGERGTNPGQAFSRQPWDTMEKVGIAWWVPEERNKLSKE